MPALHLAFMIVIIIIKKTFRVFPSCLGLELECFKQHQDNNDNRAHGGAH